MFLYPILTKCQCFRHIRFFHPLKCRRHNCIAFRTIFCILWKKRDDVIKSVNSSTVMVQYWHQMFSIFLCKCIFRLSRSQMFTNYVHWHTCCTNLWMLEGKEDFYKKQMCNSFGLCVFIKYSCGKLTSFM